METFHKTDAALAFMSSCVVAFCLIAERSCVIMMANYVGVNTVLVQRSVCVCVCVCLTRGSGVLTLTV